MPLEVVAGVVPSVTTTSPVLVDSDAVVAAVVSKAMTRGVVSADADVVEDVRAVSAADVEPSDVVAPVVIGTSAPVVAAVVIGTSAAVDGAVVSPTEIVVEVVGEAVVGWNTFGGFRLKMLSLIFVEGLVVAVADVGAAVESSKLGIRMSGNFVNGLKNGGLDPRRVVVVAGSAGDSGVVVTLA